MPLWFWFGLTSFVFCAPLSGCHDEGNVESPQPAHVDADFQEDGWPVYSGPCFLFQAPSEFDVHRQRWRHKPLNLSFKVYDRRQHQEDLLLVLEPGQSNFGDSTNERGKMEVGGMDARFHQETDERGNYSGNFVVDLPHVHPHTVSGTFRDLDAAQRDIVFRIFGSLRFDWLKHETNGVKVDADFGSEMVLNPVTYTPNFTEPIEFCSM